MAKLIGANKSHIMTRQISVVLGTVILAVVLVSQTNLAQPEQTTGAPAMIGGQTAAPMSVESQQALTSIAFSATTMLKEPAT